MTPFVADPDFQLFVGDALEVLRGLPAESVHCCVTSPPYWGLRDYGTEGQIGLESTPEAFVESMVAVFREVRRVLRADGTCFLNIGDSFYSSPTKGGSGPGGKNEARWSYGRGVRGGFPRDDASGGTRGRGRQGSSAPDSAYLDLCGECAAELSSCSPHTDPPRPGSASPASQTGRDTSPADSAPTSRAASPPAAPASTTPESSPPPLALCWRCGVRPASVSLRVATTSAPDAPGSADTAAYTDDSEPPASVSHTQDTDASALAYLYSSIASRRLRPKDAVLIPQILALALQMDGWIVRSEIIWAKKNCMPESVTDRPTKSHEQVWLLTKSPRYFFDQEAVREKYQPTSLEREKYGHNNAYGSQFAGSPTDTRSGKTLAPGEINSKARGPDGRRATAVKGGNGSIQHRDGERWPNGGRNIRSVWELATQPFPAAHFATFPEALPERCILAGTSEKGCCPKCGVPWVRSTERVDGGWDGSRYGERAVEATGGAKSGGTARSTLGSSNGKLTGKRETTGWNPSCHCGGPSAVPCVVLDPFMGSGTTALVARKLGRKSIGIELSPEYAQLAARRLQQLSLLAEPA